MYNSNCFLSYSNSSIDNKLKNNNNENQLKLYFDYDINIENSEYSDVNIPHKNKKNDYINQFQNKNNILENNQKEYKEIGQRNHISKTPPNLNIMNNEIEKNKEEYKEDDINEINLNNYPLNNYPLNNNNLIQNKINNNNEEKNTVYLFNTINQNLNRDTVIKNENNQVYNSFIITPLDIPNNKDIIKNALLNNQQNLNKLNKQIKGYNFEESINDKINRNEVDFSLSTKQLIDKYINLQISNYSQKSNLNNKSIHNNKQEISKIQDKDKKIKDGQNNILLTGNNSINITNSLLENNSQYLRDFNNERQTEILKISELSELNNNDYNNKYEKKKERNKYYEIIKEEKMNDKGGNIHKAYKNKNNKKYKPKSSALKKLIEKLKKEEDLYNNSLIKDNNKKYKYDNSNNNNNTYNNSIQLNQNNDSELFTLGNSNITSSTEKNDKSNNNNKKNNNSINKIKRHRSINDSIMEYNYKTKLYHNTEIIGGPFKRKSNNYESLTNSKEKYIHLKEEMNSIKNQIKNISRRIEIGKFSKENNYNLKKNYSTKSIKTNNNILSYISPLELDDDISYSKGKKKRMKSANNINTDKYKKKKIYKEDNSYKIKFIQLKEKFELQREKMKSEKQNIISLQQKINIIDKKYEKYPELIEYNKTLNEQNNTLVNNLEISEEVRKKQSILIEALKNEIIMIKNKKNCETVKNNDNNNDLEINNYYIESEEGFT